MDTKTLEPQPVASINEFVSLGRLDEDVFHVEGEKIRRVQKV
jgi:hypothetical protein